MFATYQNRFLPPGFAVDQFEPYWDEALGCAAELTAILASQPLSAAAQQDAVTQTAALMASLLLIARHHVIDVDLITCAMAVAARETHEGPADEDAIPRAPHHALAYLISQASSANPYMRAMGLAIGLTREPYSVGDLAAALQGSVAAQPADPFAFTRLWVGYAVLLDQIGSSMAAAMSQLVDELERQRETP
ncbi:MAG: hypothetical protein LCH73_02790 [Proteobacteria bacterium]|nr:hypothetical protein [Pseudomonadota bacterium]